MKRVNLLWIFLLSLWCVSFESYASDSDIKGALNRELHRAGKLKKNIEVAQQLASLFEGFSKDERPREDLKLYDVFLAKFKMTIMHIIFSSKDYTFTELTEPDFRQIYNKKQAEQCIDLLKILKQIPNVEKKLNVLLELLKESPSAEKQFSNLLKMPTEVGDLLSSVVKLLKEISEKDYSTTEFTVADFHQVENNKRAEQCGGLLKLLKQITNVEDDLETLLKLLKESPSAEKQFSDLLKMPTEVGDLLSSVVKLLEMMPQEEQLEDPWKLLKEMPEDKAEQFMNYLNEDAPLNIHKLSSYDDFINYAVFLINQGKNKFVNYEKKYSKDKEIFHSLFKNLQSSFLKEYENEEYLRIKIKKESEFENLLQDLELLSQKNTYNNHTRICRKISDYFYAYGVNAESIERILYINKDLVFQLVEVLNIKDMELLLTSYFKSIPPEIMNNDHLKDEKTWNIAQSINGRLDFSFSKRVAFVQQLSKQSRKNSFSGKKLNKFLRWLQEAEALLGRLEPIFKKASVPQGQRATKRKKTHENVSPTKRSKHE